MVGFFREKRIIKERLQEERRGETNTKVKVLASVNSEQIGRASCRERV